MVDVKMSLIKELREKSGAGILDCKNALSETDNDIEASIIWLRKNGYAKAAKKADRIAAEGLVAYAIRSEGNGMRGALVEVNSETDFVARNKLFQDFVTEVAHKATEDIESLENLQQASLKSGQKVSDSVVSLIATIGEKVNIRRLRSLSVSSGIVSGYVHNAVTGQAGKIGVLVALESEGDQSRLDKTAHNIALHIAANAPLAISEEGVEKVVLQRESEIYREQATASGKPENVVEKMVEGRLRKFLEESVLEKQKYLINPDITVADVIKNLEADIGSPVRLKAFHRIVLGEGVEKQEVNFADEVAGMTH